MSSGAVNSKASTLPATGASTSLIPLSVIDAPTQRVYIASAFVFIETYKVYQVLASFYIDSSSWTLFGSFLLLNLVFVTAASRLRVPRLDFSKAKWTTLFALLAASDWLACGGWRSVLSLIKWVPVLGWATSTVLNTWDHAFNRELSFSEHRVSLKDILEPKHHIFGQHTIHILPYSTAALTPTTSTSSLSNCFCLDSNNAKSEVLIPILFNNTEPQYLSYSITPFDVLAEPQVFNITISKASLTSVGSNSESRELTKKREDQLDLELEDADDQRREEGIESRAIVRRGTREVGARSTGRASQSSHTSSHHASTPSAGLLFHLPIKQVGRVKLERVLDKNRYDARLSRSEVMVVECPSMSFASKSRQVQMPSIRNKKENILLEHLCPGEDATMNVRVRGLAPLELTYSQKQDVDIQNHHSAGAKKSEENFVISHISGNSSTPNPLSSDEDRAERLSMVLNAKARSQAGPSFDWANAKDIDMPITMQLSKPGRYTYELEQVKDACGNAFKVKSVAAASRQEVQVHPRRQVSFVGCDAQRPITLLQGGQKKIVQVQIDSGKKEEGPFEVQIRYQGVEGDWQKNLTITDRNAEVTIDKAGTYTLEGLSGHYCTGEVGTPWMCTARELPPPTAVIEVDPIQDQCAGPVGVKALAVLSGTPPFKIKYTIQSKGRSLSTHEKTIDRTRDEIEFRPSAEGEITYTFTGLSDANYKDIKLDGPTFTQVLHPIAKAAFVGAQHTRGPAIVLHSCEGNTSTADVRLEGVGPFQISYAVRTRGGELAYTKIIKDITGNVYPLEVEVPSQVADKGGLLTVTLTSIKDAKGCERPLTTSDLSIDVRRSKPTITFMEPRETLLLEGAEGKLPIRLSGEGPWNVVYRRQGQGEPEIHTVINKAESNLVVAKPGVYVLEKVSDLHCPGSVITPKSTHTVSIRPRPKAAFEIDGRSQVDNKSGLITRRAVCVGEPDLAKIHLEGYFPIEITYQHRLPSKDVVTEKFTSAQEVTTIQLFTGVRGQHSYELTGVGDAIYSKDSLPVKATMKRVVQEIHPLPDVAFGGPSQGGPLKGAAKLMSLCVGDGLSGRKSAGGGDNAASGNTITLTGQTPFSIDIEIKDGMGITRKVITRSNINSHQYSLDIEPHEFKLDRTGKWTVEVTRVQDGNGCERFMRENAAVALLGEEKPNPKEIIKAKMEIEVVETANISAAEIRTDHCVGDTIEYVLQGTPPWSVTYEFEGKVSHAPIRTPTFSRIAEKPGRLKIKSIAHQSSKCQNVVEGQIGMTKMIHALPSVHVKEGKHYIEDLREGNQAEIVFKLQGIPPFSFSIQRTQAVDRFQKPIVLESYSVTDIQESSYSLFTAEEGTWSVTWLRDRYCEVALQSST